MNRFNTGIRNLKDFSLQQEEDDRAAAITTAINENVKENNLESKTKKIKQKSRTPSIPDLVSKSKQNFSAYMTIKGLVEHIGIDSTRFHLFYIKEMLDNAADYLENNYQNAKDERVITVWVTREHHNNILRIRVRNSNPANKPTAFETNLEDIFDYDYFLGSKRHKYRQSRGALGDAMKPKLSIPYALSMMDNAHHDNYEGDGVCNWNEPLVIRYNKKESKIFLDVGKFANEDLVPIIFPPKPIADTYTEIEVALPASRLSYNMINELKEYCRNYSIFSTHIRFYFHFPAPLGDSEE
jgi:hypothetical protein